MEGEGLLFLCDKYVSVVVAVLIVLGIVGLFALRIERSLARIEKEMRNSHAR